MELSKRIEAIRKELKISKTEIADKLNMDLANYARLEKQGDRLKYFQITDIANALGVSVKFLLFNEKEQAFEKEIESLNKEINTLSYINNLQKEKLENISFKVNEAFKEHILFIIAKGLERLRHLKNVPKKQITSIDNKDESLYFFISKVMDKKDPTIDDIYNYYSPYTMDDGYKDAKTEEQIKEFIKKQLELEKIREKHKEQTWHIIYSMMREYLNENKLNKHNYDENKLVWLCGELMLWNNQNIHETIDEEYADRTIHKMFALFCELNIITDEFLLGLYRLFLEWDKFDTEDVNNGKK